MEVILEKLLQQRKAFCILHVCGGDPPVNALANCTKWYSPRMWRWSWCNFDQCQCLCVFSTYVEVILGKSRGLMTKYGILHVCGGDPYSAIIKNVTIQYSPRMWRWSQLGNQMTMMKQVFSTYVEVIPIAISSSPLRLCILHVCGGDP